MRRGREKRDESLIVKRETKCLYKSRGEVRAREHEERREKRLRWREEEQSSWLMIIVFHVKNGASGATLAGITLSL